MQALVKGTLTSFPANFELEYVLPLAQIDEKAGTKSWTIYFSHYF